MMNFKSILTFTFATAYMAGSVIAGQAAWYRPNGAMGTCGSKIKNNDLVALLPKEA